MASRRLIADDGTFRTYESLDDAGNVIGQAREQYVFPPEQVNADRLRTTLAAQIAPGSPARNAVAGNTTYINGAKPGTAAAQASAAYDQAKALSQQNNVLIPTLLRVIRLALGALDDDK